MLEVCLLGTGGTVPLPGRWLTSCLLRCAGTEVLIDCGEGTQIALHREGFSCRHIDTILFTHYHADHTAGLPGLLLSMAKADRTEPVTVIGPKGIESFLKGVMLIARYVPFEIRYMEITEKEASFTVGMLKITAFALRHSVPCFGYRADVSRSRRFDPEKAKNNNVPVRIWRLLQKEETVEYEGITYTPDMVLGEQRRGLRLVYATDTRPCEAIRVHAENADLLIGEGMYGCAEGKEKAEKNRHMTMQECAAIAKDAGVRELWFTHYSPSEYNPQIYAEEIHEIFAAAVISEDGQRTDLAFEHEEADQ